VDDEVPGAVEEDTGPPTVRRVPPSLLGALPVNALGALGIAAVVRDVDPCQVVGDVADAAHVPIYFRLFISSHYFKITASPSPVMFWTAKAPFWCTPVPSTRGDPHPTPPNPPPNFIIFR